ncbi:MAG: 2-C-methyl-D-erythritol 2,4-cyclodiphosphate synthase [Candidatus Melainabacteria bacterium GWF2_32_7]|nr:MAG: 2-C-methyl-D-erythritol 2,4-cyclodiphosphate synthase [Candidatus Melainabacteria bacterium GWF2_32_7]OGI21099.1 MAG: 2-C-methyl-D-erythritol 2,4-cyclodiphosphate synthase [Candidatus Melainabacteria bacterium RIFOXYA2_FULL_32_9]
MNQQYRVGNGYDIHKLVEGRKLILGGIEIPYHLGLLGHSDADILTHSIMDAMLGAVSIGDIGRYFPPSDPVYKDIDSLELLKKVKYLVEAENYKINNIDTVIQAERPKLAGYIFLIKEKLAEVLEIDVDQISVKATTMEGMGPVGEGKAIAAHAVILLEKMSK